MIQLRRFRKAFPKGRLANLVDVWPRLDQGACGGKFVAEGCRPQHGVAQVVRSRSGQMEAIPGPLPEGTPREEGRPQAAEGKEQSPYRHLVYGARMWSTTRRWS